MKYFLYLCSVLFWNIASAQQLLTLEQCLDLVIANQSLVSTEISAVKSEHVNLRFHTLSLFPSLSLSSGLNTSFGRRVDPFTNTFATSKVNSQSFGLNSGMVLFNGFNYKYSKRLFQENKKQKEINLQQRKNELLIRVIELYFTRCKQEIQLELSKTRVSKYNDIQRLQKLLLKEGRITPLDTLKSYNSILNEGLQFQDLLLDQKMKTIELNYLLKKPLTEEYLVDISSISVISRFPELISKNTIELLQSELIRNEFQYKQQRTAYLPSINLNGNIGTGFSTNNKDFTVVGTPTKRYNVQIEQNLYEGIGFNLNFPLFNRGALLKAERLTKLKEDQIKDQLELAKLDLEKEQIELQQQQLFNKSKQAQLLGIIQNLDKMYATTTLLYQNGRATYTDLETVLLESEQKRMELEILRIESIQLGLFK